MKNKQYVFNYLLYTDGISVSMVQVKKELYGRRMIRNNKKKDNFKYVDELDENELDELKKCKILGCDPGSAFKKANLKKI